jgi:hypothetical protein
LSEVAVRQRLTVFERSFFGPQILKIPLFLSFAPPDGFVGWASPTNHLTRLIDANERSLKSLAKISAHQGSSFSQFGGTENGEQSPPYKTLPERLKICPLPAMSPKLADEVAKNNKNLCGFFSFVGSRAGYES